METVYKFTKEEIKKKINPRDGTYITVVEVKFFGGGSDVDTHTSTSTSGSPG